MYHYQYRLVADMAQQTVYPRFQHETRLKTHQGLQKFQGLWIIYDYLGTRDIMPVEKHRPRISSE